MLAPKKIEKNKLIIYVSVIAIMIAGMGFFLYKNYSLTATKKTMTMEAPAGMAVQENKGADSAMEQPKPEEELLDLGLLADTKFKKLRESTIEEGGFKVGKSNPFAPDQNNEIKE